MNRRHKQCDSKNIIKAYKLLFSGYGEFSIEHMNRMSLATLKGVFRAKAKEAHPDKSKSLEIQTEILTEKFKEISEAYSCLSAFLERNRVIKSNINSRPGNFKYSPENSGSGKSPFSKSPRNGRESVIGRKELLFGQFLYQAGHISFMSLVNAIIWQRSERELYGKIAGDWGILKHQDIILILNNWKPFEKFGECSMRLGLVTPIQHNSILTEQRKNQRRIGEFFIQNGTLTQDRIQELLRMHETHNMNIKMKKKRSR